MGGKIIGKKFANYGENGEKGGGPKMLSWKLEMSRDISRHVFNVPSCKKDTHKTILAQIKCERKLRKRETKWGQIGDKQRDKKGGKGYLIR